MKKISLILKNTREDLDLTQVDVMHSTGINNKTLSGYENGVSEPDLETFAKLISLYGLSADDILEIDSSKASLNIDEQQLVHCFRKLSKKQQSDFLKMINAICE